MGADRWGRISVVEQAFRSCKTVDLKVRPIFHRLPHKVKAHVFFVYARLSLFCHSGERKILCLF
jgi:hypothetical protein